MIFQSSGAGLYDNASQHQISTGMNQMIANQAATAGGYANHLIDRRKIYDDVEDGLIKEANNYDSDARISRELGRARGDVEQGFSNSLDQMQRQMASAGVDPTSGAALAAMRQLTAQKALGLVGASNTARRAIEDGAFQRRMAVGGLGKGLNADITNSQAAAGKLGETAMTSLMDANTRKESAAASAANAAASAANAAANQALAASKFSFDKEQWEWGKTNLTAAQQADNTYRNRTFDANFGLAQDKQTASNIGDVVGGIYTLAKDGTLKAGLDWLTNLGGGSDSAGPAVNYPQTATTVNGYTFSEAAAQNQSGLGADIPSRSPMDALVNGDSFADWYTN